MVAYQVGVWYRSSVEEADRAGVDLMYETNLFGPIALIKAVLPEMRARKSGAIVNVSSIGAASGYYASTKSVPRRTPSTRPTSPVTRTRPATS